MTDLSRKTGRDRLRARREPYWHRLDAGAHLGYRAGADTWVVRYRPAKGDRQYKALDVPAEARDAFLAAKRLAEDWLASMTGVATRNPKRSTVRAALQAYIDDLKRHRREAAAKDALSKFHHILADRIADFSLESLTREDMLAWRDRASQDITPQTSNRNLRSIKAALTRALDLGHVGNPKSWDIGPLQEDDAETAVFLTPAQRTAILSKCDVHSHDFFRAIALTGARPSEIANARVADFDGENVRLVHRKGKSSKPRPRYVTLGADGIAHFKQAAKGKKLPQALLFTEDGEQHWRKHVWAKRINKAIKAHNKECKEPGQRVPEEATAYAYRHTRISELLQLHHIDPLTVAAQTGTSVAIIERNYYKFISSAMREKLASVKESS